MAMLKSINRYSSAHLAPTTLPAGALMLVEIDGRVFRLNAANLAAVATVPAAQGAVGVVWNDNGVLKVRMS